MEESSLHVSAMGMDPNVIDMKKSGTLSEMLGQIGQ